MQCRCGAKQYYVCRKTDIAYDHFCRCGQIEHGKCSTCQKTCKLFENAEELDEIRINELQQQHRQPVHGKPKQSKPEIFDRIAQLFQ